MEGDLDDILQLESGPTNRAIQMEHSSVMCVCVCRCVLIYEMSEYVVCLLSQSNLK